MRKLLKFREKGDAHLIIHNDRQEIEQALNYVEEGLKKYNLNKRDITMATLTAEESIVCLMDHAPENAEIEIVFKRIFGNVSLNISAPGEPFDVADSSAVMANMELNGIGPDMENAIRSLIFRSQSESFRYKNKHHRNTRQIAVKRSDRVQLYLTLGALALSIILQSAGTASPASTQRTSSYPPYLGWSAAGRYPPACCAACPNPCR